MYERQGAGPLGLVNLLRGRRVTLLPHNFPDPDALGSLFGLQQFLEHYGIESRICYVGAIDRITTRMMIENFGIRLYSYEEIKDSMAESDYVVNVDCQKPNANTTDIVGDEVACIDHHPVFIKTDEYRYTDIRTTGACASIIASYYKETNTPIDATVAAALAYAIKMDTADLIRGTTAFDMDMMAYLFRYADWRKVADMYHFAIEYTDLNAYGEAIKNIAVYDHVGFSFVSFECTNALVATLCDFILSLDVVDLAVVYALNSDGVRFSVRSIRAEVHAGQLVQSAFAGIGSGGGHAAMAGGFIPEENLRQLGEDFHEAVKALFLKELGLAGSVGAGRSF